MRGFFVTATDTGVGKTEVASYLVRMLSKRGYKVGVMKPVATGTRGGLRDAEILRRSSSSRYPTHYINPISLNLPLAPMVAADIEKKKIDTKIIWQLFKVLNRDNDLMVVEGIGGIMVPITKIQKRIFYVVDMILKMGLPVIIVARPDLGTINHTLLTVRMLKQRGIKIAGIIINHTSRIKKDLSIKTNPKVIERLSGTKVLGIMPYERQRHKRRIRWLRRLEF
ncbi:MAG: dethiobiotin synthase [Candidatus Omnitrophota bacterium]